MKTALSVILVALLLAGCDRESRYELNESPRPTKPVVVVAKTPAAKTPTAKTPAGGDPEARPAEGDQDKPNKPDEGAVHRALEQFHAALKNEGIEIDLAKKTLTVPTVVNRPTNDLEFLLIHRQGKSHEALLVTECKPSVLNTGLLALGVKPGKNASFKKKDPMPSEEELRAGADPYILVPPAGGEMFMTAAFIGKDGKKVEVPVEELLLDWTANVSVANAKWVYLGGRMAQMYRGEPEVYMADFEGNLISVCYKHPHNHLLTMVHERARDEMNWAIAPACPPPGTEVSLIFHRHKPKLVAAREARVLKRVKPDLATRPERNPAREGGEAPPPPKKKDSGKKNK